MYTMKKILWLMAFAILIGNLFAGLSLPSYVVTPTSLRPEANGVITLTVSNPIPSTGTGSKVYSISLSLYPPGSITSTDKVIVGDLDIGSSTTISVPIYVKAGTKSGIYIYEVRAIGYTATGTYTGDATQSNFQAATIPISIVDAPLFSISSDKEVVGDVEPISLTITNNGGVANRVRVSVNSTGFAMLGKDEVFVGSIKDISKVNLTLDSRNANNGANDVAFLIRYQDELGNELSEKKSARITVKKENLDLEFIQKSAIITRKDGVLTLLVRDNGKPLSDVRISFNSDSIKLKEASEFKLGDLEEGSSKEISLPVFTTLAPGTNYVYFTVKYFEKGVEKEQAISVPITVTSDADVSVYLDAKPAPLAVGQEHTLSVLVSNVGSYEISSVDVGISSPALESLDVHESEYIGGLNKDDFSTVQFKVKVNEIQPGNYPLDIMVKYRDQSGEWKTKTINETIIIHAPQSSGNGSVLYLIVLVVLAAIAVWYFKLRKKDTKQKTSQS